MGISKLHYVVNRMRAGNNSNAPSRYTMEGTTEVRVLGDLGPARMGFNQPTINQSVAHAPNKAGLMGSV